MKKILLVLCVLSLRLEAKIIYAENWEGYAVGTTITTIGWSAPVAASGVWYVNTGKVANNPGQVTWSHIKYDGAVYTNGEFSVVVTNNGVRANPFFRVNTLSAVNSIPADGYQIQDFGNGSAHISLWKGGYATQLGSTYTGTIPTTHTITIGGGTGTVWVKLDGTYICGTPVSDATTASGYIGMGAFSAGETWDNLTFDDGIPNVSDPTRHYLRTFSVLEFLTPKLYAAVPSDPKFPEIVSEVVRKRKEIEVVNRPFYIRDKTALPTPARTRTPLPGVTFTTTPRPTATRTPTR